MVHSRLDKAEPLEASDNRQLCCATWKGAGYSSGCESHPANSVAPAGSYRSGGRGNETAEAFETTGRPSDSASSQAVTRVNVEQASKDLTWKPARLYIGEGRSRWGKEAHAS